jgi:hypothetical protein
VQGQVGGHLADQSRKGSPRGRGGQHQHRAAHHLAHIAGQRSGVWQLGGVAQRKHRFVDEMRLARPAPVDRGLTGTGPLRDRIDREPGIPALAEQVDRGLEHCSVDA